MVERGSNSNSTTPKVTPHSFLGSLRDKLQQVLLHRSKALKASHDEGFDFKGVGERMERKNQIDRQKSSQEPPWSPHVDPKNKESD